MESVYKNMQPCSNQKDQVYYGPYYYPGMEAIPPQMHVNSGRPPMGYGWWPWGGNYGGVTPSACHSCCNHSYIPAQCAWGSPYHHVPQHHCPGNYPSFPVQYMPPPPFYGMGQPRYEYEKNVPREHHCCGCSNHPFYEKEPKNVRIEEEEPERERRNFDSLVPFQSKSSPNPVVWLPPDYSGSKEQEKVKNTGDWREGSHDGKANENGKVAGQNPAFRNGWLPLDLNNLTSAKNRGGGEENPQQVDGNRDFPFPLFWIPYKPEEKEGEKHKMKDGNATPSLELEKGSGGEQNVHLNRENIGDQAPSKLRDIPVKEVAKHVEKETSTKQEKERNAGEKKANKGSAGKSPSPQKSSKLPPVCLRVDPLPRRKTGNGSSQPNEARKVIKSSENKEQAKILHNELKEDKATKTIEVVDGRTHGDNMDVKVEAPVMSGDDVLTNQVEEKPGEGQISQNHAEIDAVVKSQSEDAGSAREKNEEIQEMGEVKKLSEEEAAVIIQSVYRGFDVRKWELIKKLKQIAKVREQIADVEHLIQAMKSCSDIQGRRKQRNVIAETIMSLLLKLDTIQGVHPSIRAVRKSAVKELVNLQEQLDSLMNKQLENSPGQELMMMMTRDEDASNKSEGVVSSQNGNETTPTDLWEAHQNQIDGGSNHESSEISEAGPIGETAIEKTEEEAAESCFSNDVESAPGPTIEEDGKSNKVLENTEIIPKEGNDEDLVLEHASELSSLQNQDSAMEAPEPTIKEDEKLNNDEAVAKEDHVDLVLEQGSDLSPLQSDDSAKATDCDMPPSELPEADQPKQMEEALIEPPTISEPHEAADSKDSNQTVETQEVSDLPINSVDVEPDTETTNPIKGSQNNKSDDNLSEEEVGDRNGDVRTEPDECPPVRTEPYECPPQPQNLIAHMTEPSGNDITPQSVVTEINDSEVVTSEQAQAIEEGHNTEQPSQKEALEEQGSYEENVVDPTLVSESNRKLVEENERLRDMMERLIKSGQEQLTAISSLSGRVKDLEKKLFRKKKLKLKQHKPPKSNLHA